MRRLFAHYGLLMLALVGGFTAITIFISVFLNEENAIGNILGLWLSHLM
ncbi:MAG: hypothetical protein IJJ00_04365 [Erysipelotrichaceae bacterium]|nr:hypothetical protein [Erysipelotrichaceae bacterium]